jgi:S1-C subfamily serine protease
MPRTSTRPLRSAAAAVLAASLVVVPVGAPVAAAPTTSIADWRPGPFSHGSPWGAADPRTTLAASTDAASDAESRGVVLVDTSVDYGAGEAAGTGLVIGREGIVVTNHHVVEGSTKVTVTVPSTGRTYVADVVGADATADVAVLRLRGATGLATVSTDVDLTTGSAVTAVGNAFGGGSLVAADGTVQRLRTRITVSDDSGGQEDLRHLIEISSDVVPGDSGGAVLDGDGDVVGMTVAASSGGTDVVGYAIPIAGVQRVAARILAGVDTARIDLGYDAALGVAVGGSSSLTVAGVVPGGAAARAGLAAGDTLRSLHGVDVATLPRLRRVLAGLEPGDTVALTWTGSSGRTHSGTVTLGRAPVA